MNEETLAALRSVAAIASDMGPALAPVGRDELLRSITDAAKDLFGAAACSLALLEENELVFLVASGEGADEVIGMRVPVTRGIAGWVVSSGQPIAISDVRRDPRFATDVAESTGYVPRSILAMPLETERAMLGVISVLDRDVEARDTARDMEHLALFARQASLAIENNKVFSDLGRALFEALSHVTGDTSLVEALNTIAAERNVPDPELAALAAQLAALRTLGRRERRAATELLDVFVRYAKS